MKKTMTALALVMFGAAGFAGCSKDLSAMDADQIEQQYGVGGARAETITTADGPIRGTLVPITLANGKQGQLFIPQKQAREPHAVYVRDDQGLHPVQLKDNVTREQLAQSPAIVATQTEPAHANKRSWEKEALIIGGTAGGGAAIGAIAGGKKGAGIGAAAGGVGGLIYDLMTRDKK